MTPFYPPEWFDPNRADLVEMAALEAEAAHYADQQAEYDRQQKEEYERHCEEEARNYEAMLAEQAKQEAAT